MKNKDTDTNLRKTPTAKNYQSKNDNQRDETKKRKIKIYCDRHTSRPLKNLVMGDSVMMQVKNYWKPAKVTAVTQNTPRSYEVQTPEG